MRVQVKASYKLSEDFKKGPAKPKKAKKPAAAKPKKVCTPPFWTICIERARLGNHPGVPSAMCILQTG